MELTTLRCLKDDCDGKLMITRIAVKEGKLKVSLICGKCEEDYQMMVITGLPVFVGYTRKAIN